MVAAWTGLIVDHAVASGLDPGPILARAGVDPGALASPDGRIAARADDQVWRLIAAELGDADLGIHLSEQSVSVGSFGVVGYLARASATVGDALARAARYHRLIKDDSRVQVAWSERGAALLEAPGPERGMWPRAVAEAIMANYLTLARAWTGQRIAPLEVRFQHARPGDTRELERFFGCRLRFGERENGIALSRDALALPFRTSEPALLDYLEAWAGARMAALGDRTLAGQAQRAIGEALAEGEPSIDRVARRLALSPRSLQRRLREQGLSFRGLVDAVRQRRAVELVQSGLGLDEVAERLGFAEPRSFRRAFRRWTGLAPSALRPEPAGEAPRPLVRSA